MIKKIIQSFFHSTGYQISKLPKSETQNPNKPLKQEELAFYDTPIGKYFLPTNAPRDIIIQAMKQGQYFEPEVIEIAKKYIKKDSVVLDIGSNLGQMSILFSDLVGKEGQVYAFDADDYIFEILNKNVQANQCDNIITQFGAVYHTPNLTLLFPKQDFKRFEAYGSYGIDLHAHQGREVKSITIDELNIQKSISFMKVDVQGSDLFAMQGAINTIEKHKMPILFEFEQQFQKEFNTSFQDYVDFVQAIDYKFTEIIMGINYLIVPK
jgi:FkbM family methyltransferase